MTVENRLRQILIRVGELQSTIAKLQRENETLRKTNKFLKLEVEQGGAGRVEKAYTSKEECILTKPEAAGIKREIKGYIAEIDKSLEWLKQL